MAGNGNSGGDRPTAPQNNPANISATGGNGQSGQKISYIPDMRALGSSGVETVAQQQGATMYKTPAVPTTKGLGSFLGGETMSLSAPTTRPNEDISTGMPFNANTPGPETLNIPNQNSLSGILANMIDLDPTGEVADLHNFLVSRGL